MAGITKWKMFLEHSPTFFCNWRCSLSTSFLAFWVLYTLSPEKGKKQKLLSGKKHLLCIHYSYGPIFFLVNYQPILLKNKVRFYFSSMYPYQYYQSFLHTETSAVNAVKRRQHRAPAKPQKLGVLKEVYKNTYQTGKSTAICAW